LLSRVEKLHATHPYQEEAVRQPSPEAAMLKKRTRIFIGTSIFSGLLLCLLLALNVSKSAKLDRSNDLMRALLKQTDSLRQENAGTSTKMENDSLHSTAETGPGVDQALSHFFAMFSENDSRLVTLASSPLGTARQHLFFSPKQRMIALLRENLKALDANKTYTLWATVGGKAPIAIGNFRVDSKKNSPILTFPTKLKTADSFSISIESGNGGGNNRGNVIFTGEVPPKGIN
ncbi:MAG: anti-sigma factor, partial [Bacteroidota bacterium]|nr:anti-sigma factor [Bacteroidota bacterium]